MAEQKPKVLHLPKWYPERNAPLSGIFVQKHIRAINLFCSNAVLYVSSDAALQHKVYDLQKNTEGDILTVRVYYQKVTSGIPVLSHLLKLYRNIRATWKGYQEIIKEIGYPARVHVHVLAGLHVLALYLKIFHRIPYVITEHWSGYLPEDGSYKGAWLKFATRLMVHHASAVTTVSETLKHQMLNRHRLRSHYYVTPNIVETVNPISLQPKNDSTTILVVCDLIDEVKNVSGIIKAMADIVPSHGNCVLHIIGDGKDRKKLEEMATAYGLLNKNIFFKGEIPNHQVYESMVKSGFLILNSNHENFPCVILEAFACGIPVIATRVGGIPEIINEQNGILIEKQNATQLKEAITLMISHHTQYDRLSLHRYAQSRFSYETVGKQFQEIYLQIND